MRESSIPFNYQSLDPIPLHSSGSVSAGVATETKQQSPETLLNLGFDRHFPTTVSVFLFVERAISVEH